MKKLFLQKYVSFSLLLSSFFCMTNSSKSEEYDSWAIDASSHILLAPSNDPEIPQYGSPIIKIYEYNSSTGDANLKKSYQTIKESEAIHGQGNWQWKLTKMNTDNATITHDELKGVIKFTPNSNESKDGIKKEFLYNIATNSFSIEDVETIDESKYTKILKIPLITKKDNGEIHIGKNSWITKEENGRQKVWAKDAAGNSIPIDYTNGTKLLINGRDVEQSINNVGALSAALTGLPTVPTNTTLACGLGTGTHGGDFAFSGGCASKVNDKLSINYAASMTMPGQDYAGDFEDTFSARAGFVWKLGKATKPTQISMKEKKELKKEISDLKANNNQIISQNKNLQLENQSIISQNNALLARLERLEKVALGDLKSKDFAVYKLK